MIKFKLQDGAGLAQLVKKAMQPVKDCIAEIDRLVDAIESRGITMPAARRNIVITLGLVLAQLPNRVINMLCKIKDTSIDDDYLVQNCKCVIFMRHKPSIHNPDWAIMRFYDRYTDNMVDWEFANLKSAIAFIDNHKQAAVYNQLQIDYRVHEIIYDHNTRYPVARIVYWDLHNKPGAKLAYHDKI